MEPGLREIIANCLAASVVQDTAQRKGYSSAQQLTEDLECLLANRPLRHAAETTAATIYRRWRRYRVCVLGMTAFVAAVCLVFIADRYTSASHLSAAEASLAHLGPHDGNIRHISEESLNALFHQGLFPDSPTMQMRRAELCHGFGAEFLKQGESAEAVPLLERAVVLAPHSGGAWNDLGVARFQRTDYAAAINAFNRAMTLSCDHASVLSNRGAAYAATNEEEKARRDFRQALKIDGSNGAAKQHLRLLNSLTVDQQL